MNMKSPKSWKRRRIRRKVILVLRILLKDEEYLLVL
jgi:hypothetical protein